MMKIGASGRRSESDREYTILALTKPNSVRLTEEAWRHIKNLSRQRYARAFSYSLTNAKRVRDEQYYHDHKRRNGQSRKAG
jgi:hypothetical protein